FAVRFIPRENGVYSIDVKFDGSHIPGSPFKVRVGEPGQAGDPGLVSAYGPGLEGGTTGSPYAGMGTPGTLGFLLALGRPAAAAATAAPGVPRVPSDATKVVAKGLGLNKAFVGQKNSFTVDCSKAGNNMLLVGVQGPRAPCEEIVVKHLGNQLYNVGYLLRDRGDYVLVVKWGDQHVPNSPFHVSVP
ncbi:PREDICTED: filamin-B-like, partial [Tinamus guttatus]|uniref:filamin-B-like n=1 Tax=Tinamus guttatus TaxID=94827 RepID=UPI00052F2AB1